MTKKLGIPTLEKVEEIFLAISPDFPIPAKITFPLQFKIKSTALMKELLKTFFIFFTSAICISAAFLASVKYFFYSLMFKNIKFKSILI